MSERAARASRLGIRVGTWVAVIGAVRVLFGAAGTASTFLGRVALLLAATVAAFAPQLKRDPLGGPNMSVHVDAFIEKFRAIVDRYLTGQQALEPAAADVAHVWRDWLRQAGPDASELPTPQPRDTLFPGANVLH